MANKTGVMLIFSQPKGKYKRLTILYIYAMAWKMFCLVLPAQCFETCYFFIIRFDIYFTKRKQKHKIHVINLSKIL